jgi:hypothetical protein
VAPVGYNPTHNTINGVNGNVGNIAVRDALVISNNGKAGNLLVTLVNTGDKKATVLIQHGDSASGNHEVTVGAGASKRIGGDGETRVQFEDIATPPGALVPIYFQYGTATGVQLKVPVLTNTLSQYVTATPTPLPKKTATPTPTPGVTGAATPTPTPTP